MTPIPVPHRWLAALLGAALLVDLILASAVSFTNSFPPLPGAAVLCVCAYFALTRPVIGALLGTATLVGSSLVIRLAGAYPASVGIQGIVLSETVAGAALVVLVVWRCRPLVAAGCVTALVFACLTAMLIRREITCADVYMICPTDARDVFPSLVFGLFVLVGSVSVGGYLRYTGQQRILTPTDTLIRKQWPLGVALAVLLMADLTNAGYPGTIGLIGFVGAGVCAFFAPLAPLRYALLGAASLVVFPLLVGYDEVSVTSIAASMAMIAYAVRQLPRPQAVNATVALVAANLLLLVQVSGNLFEEPSVLLLLGILLVISVAAGLYFRSRDRERTQTVKAAVTSAQQGERMALARELHDVVAHHVTGIVVQAQAALLVAEHNPAAAVTALERIEHSGGEALTAMRTLVGGLRDGTAAWTAGDSKATGQATTDLVADIQSMVEHFVGPPVELDLHLPEQLGHEVGRSVLRLIQESLTNVGKHAPDASLVRVRVVNIEEGLHIRVSDDGAKRPAQPAGGSGGYGLVGMRERVELLGGRFEAGPSGYVGWTVEAWLPLRKEGS